MLSVIGQAKANLFFQTLIKLATDQENRSGAKPLRPARSDHRRIKIMKKYLLTATLVFGLTGIGAFAQSSSPQDSNHPGATPPTFPSDTQDKAQPKTDQASPEQGQQMPQSDQADQDKPQQNPNGDTSQNPSQPNTDQSSPTSSQSGSSSASGASSMGSSGAASSDPQSQIQSALQQQPNLSGVQVSVNQSEIELTGTVPTGKDKKDAEKLAKSSANGMKVVNHIKVAGKGEANGSQSH
jgi:hypothetical protein